MSEQTQQEQINKAKHKHPGAGRRKARMEPRGRGAEQSALQEICELLGNRPHDRRNLIHYLHHIQDKYGCLSFRHLSALAREMGLSHAQVHEVASFYSQFVIVGDGETAAPIILRVCDSLACSLKNADQLLENCKEFFDDNVKVEKAPCTPYGVQCLLEHIDVPIEGQHAVIVGRSNIVGKPMAMLLLQMNATISICTSKTQNLADITNLADILVVATGRPHMITGDMVKKDAVVIDVGINRLDDGRLVGDVDFDSVKEKAAYITPVPGGVGPMTITMLVVNTVKAAERAAEK